MFKTKGGWSQRLFVKKETAELISWGIPPTLTNSKLPLSPKMIGKNLCDISGTEWPRHYQKNPICIAFHSFSTIFSYKWAGNMSVYSMKSMFWTNEKLSFMVAWSSSFPASKFRVLLAIWFGFTAIKGTLQFTTPLWRGIFVSQQKNYIILNPISNLH